MNVHELLIETHAHMPPLRALEGLTPEDADRRVTGVEHSVAEIVAHMGFWQNWFCRRCRGEAVSIPGHASDGWPAVAKGTWADVHRQFASGLEDAVALGARGEERVAPAIEFGPLAHYTVGNALQHMAQHNSHHTGQVILLRQLMGLWPPPAGSFTW
jgi:uncharacterized damage-inducible protein DinB